MKQVEKKQVSCYFTAEELKAIEEIGARLERPRSQIVQFAVRAYERLVREDPQKAQQVTGATH